MGRKLERLVIFWFMNKGYFRLPTQTMQYYKGNLATWAENCIVWSHQKWVIYIVPPDNWLTSLRTPLHLWLCFENHVRQSGMQRQPACFLITKVRCCPRGSGAGGIVLTSANQTNVSCIEVIVFLLQWTKYSWIEIKVFTMACYLTLPRQFLKIIWTLGNPFWHYLCELHCLTIPSHTHIHMSF